MVRTSLYGEAPLTARRRYRVSRSEPGENKRKPVPALRGSFAVAIGEVTAGMAVEGEDAGEGLASVGFFGPRDEFGRALGDDAAAALAAFRAEVDDPVGLFDDVEMVLDDEHGVAKIDQALENVEEFTNVVEVQASCRFIQNVERAPGLSLGKLTGQFDALGFATGERRGGLAEGNVAQADLDERREFLLNLGNVF